jgi:CRISP-associated protein Cas1
MIKRTLYFGNPAYLSTNLEQLVVRLPEVEKNETLPEIFKKEHYATIPIEDIGVVVIDHQRITISQALIAKLLNNNVALITCNNTHMPTGLMLNLDGNTLQSQRFKAQLDASEPLKKQLWQQTIRAKIKNQAFALSIAGLEIQNMLHWADEVKSGDAENHEGRAAAWYWKNIFRDQLPGGSPDFIRDPDGEAPNPLLNYAYAIIRAVAARALVGSGLLPTLGIFHRNQYNAYCLADDIMEPYRPFADMAVKQIIKSEGIMTELTPTVKKKILALPAIDVSMGNEKSPLMIAMQRTSAALAKCFLGESRKLLYPDLL